LTSHAINNFTGGLILVEKIKVTQGAGGELMDTLIKEKILKYFVKEQHSEVSLSMLDDSAVIDDIVFLQIHIQYNP